MSGYTDLRSPEYLARRLEEAEARLAAAGADLKYARESWGLVDLKCQELTGRLAAAERNMRFAAGWLRRLGPQKDGTFVAEALALLTYDAADAREPALQPMDRGEILPILNNDATDLNSAVSEKRLQTSGNREGE